MDTIRDIRIRLKSIDSTKQITESMRMISTRKAQKTKVRMGDNRAYLNQSSETLKEMINSGKFNDHAYIKQNITTENKPLIIVITGDRGLCGGYNINASKEAVVLAQTIDGDATFLTIGTKGRDYLNRRNHTIVGSYKGLSENPFYRDAMAIGNIVLNMYNEKTIDEVYLVYTEYHTMLVQTPVSSRILPFDPPNAPIVEPSASDEQKYETDANEIFETAASTYIYAKIFGAMLESAVCEQCAKLTSMDSAVKNSEKIIDSLKLQYNQMRQSAITQEIAEIVGGANAVEDK